MKRSTHLKKIQAKKKPWDVLIIGGGASGLGAAVDAASRGYRTLLLEKMILPKAPHPEAPNSFTVVFAIYKMGISP